MRQIAFTEFRKNASRLIAQVAQGERLVILRRGKPVAEIIPYRGESRRTPAWKRPGLRLRIPGAELSAAVLEERDEER